MDATKRFGIAVGLAGLFVFMLPVMVTRVSSDAAGTPTLLLTQSLSSGLAPLFPIAVLVVAGALLLSAVRSFA